MPNPLKQSADKQSADKQSAHKRSQAKSLRHLSPYLSVRGALAAIDFYVKAFGAP
jgi:hypothetical protein